jgi:hypothetical protein
MSLNYIVGLEGCNLPRKSKERSNSKPLKRDPRMVYYWAKTNFGPKKIT